MKHWCKEPIRFYGNWCPGPRRSNLTWKGSILLRFDEKESISGVQQLKSSVQKGIRARILELYPHLENHMDQVLPKKDTFRIVKCHDHIEIMVNGAGELLFFRQREGPWMPTLRLLHKYPFFLPMQQVDKGAIRFVLSGANIMCPGLTSPGARMSAVDKGQVVAVMAEGKEHALAVGCTALSTDDIAKVNKGVGIENFHYLNDGLWQMKPVK
ncbi:PUA domain-containing protein [Phthorimaea operculella]|nr:PUA domain-containing protein [Phthorimaea operculella]